MKESAFQVITITVVGIAFLALCVCVINVRNQQIEAQCIAKGGQVLVTPGKFSSCLYPVK